jgi:hypothetical protein
MSSLTDHDERINDEHGDQGPRAAPANRLFANLPRIKIVQPTTPRASTAPNSQLDLCGSALFYAQRGWPVFPCAPAKHNGEGGKSPRIKDWQGLATTDRERIIDWWTEMPTSNVGVLCGPRSGLLIVDVDYKPDRDVDGWRSLAALEAAHGSLPTGPRVRRGESSTHVYFEFDARLGNSVGHLPGIDVRSDGGFVVGALSFHAMSGDRYEWIDGTAKLPLPKLPEWLIAALSKPMIVPNRRTSVQRARAETGGELPQGASVYAAAALAAEVENVANAVEGTRNSTLNNAAFSIGTLVGAGAIDRDDVDNALFDAALACGLSDEEAERTIKSGLDAGERQPRDLSHLGGMSRRVGLEEEEIEEDLK